MPDDGAIVVCYYDTVVHPQSPVRFSQFSQQCLLVYDLCVYFLIIYPGIHFKGVSRFEVSSAQLILLTS